MLGGIGEPFTPFSLLGGTATLLLFMLARRELPAAAAAQAAPLALHDRVVRLVDGRIREPEVAR